MSLPSGLLIRIKSGLSCVVGRLSNQSHKAERLSSAGAARRLGHRPSVRGIAMNPVDHPHGGKSNTPKPEVSPWG